MSDEPRRVYDPAHCEAADIDYLSSLLYRQVREGRRDDACSTVRLIEVHLAKLKRAFGPTAP